MIYAIIVLAVLVAGLVIAMAVAFSRLKQVEERAERHSHVLRGEVEPKLKDLEPLRQKMLRKRLGTSGTESSRAPTH